MFVSSLLLESGLRRFSSKRTFEGQCVHIDRVTAEDGEPERFSISRAGGQELMLFNQRGSLLLKRVDDTGWDVIPAGGVALVTNANRIEGILPRGAHQSYWAQWTQDSAPLLSKWLAEQRTASGKPGGIAVVRSNAQENKTIASEMIASVVGTMPMVEPRVLGGLQMLAVSAVSDPKTMVLTPIPTDLASGLRHLVERVHADPVNDWNLKVAAQVAGYSQFHLSRTFRVELGYGLPEFVERCRVELALNRISSTSIDLHEIAIACGFSTPSAFREALKKILGVLPSELRRFTLH